MQRRFTEEANVHYTHTDDEALGTDHIRDMIRHHMANQQPRLKQLEDYYKGDNHTILKENRRKEDHLADHRATHNFAKYVSQFIQGYMVGVPLKTSYSDDESVDKQLRDINRVNDADEHNSQLVLDQSIYGRAYELLYRDQDDQTRFTNIDVKETFVIYDDTVECNPIAGVRYMTNQFTSDVNIEVYTDDSIEVYTAKDYYFYDMYLVDEKPHAFQGVPIIEYENNKFRQGDFEDALNLIDLYDAAQSDTANFMTDTNDAYLVIKGNVDLDLESADEMKRRNILLLKSEVTPDGRETPVDAGYIYKQYDVNGLESYKKRIVDDILLFTSIPNLLDENFAGSQSGEAIKMKLFGLEQKRATKERLFKRSLRNRYRLINNIMSVAAEGAFDVNEIDITFTENLPRSINQELEWFSKLGGKLSDETLLSLLSFVENPQEEMERIKEENEQNKPLYDFQLPMTDPNQDDEEVSDNGEEQ